MVICRVIELTERIEPFVQVGGQGGWIVVSQARGVMSELVILVVGEIRDFLSCQSATGVMRRWLITHSRSPYCSLQVREPT